jgi:hypothetical protein
MRSFANSKSTIFVVHRDRSVFIILLICCCFLYTISTYSCQFMYLKSHAATQRSKCCMNGYLVWGVPDCPFTPLKPYPPEIVKMFFADPGHFSGSSAMYNRTLSIADTSLDNGRKGNGVERRFGDNAVTINGSVTYYVRKDALKSRGGLSYFTHDGLNGLESHAERANEAQSTASGSRYGPRLDLEHLTAIFEGLKRDNRLCAELNQTGLRIMRPDEDGNFVAQLTQELTATINGGNNFFEVGAWTGDNVLSNRTFRYRLNGTYKQLDSYNQLVEPLVYPLLFWHGEDGFDFSNRHLVSYHQYLRGRMLIPEAGWQQHCPLRLPDPDGDGIDYQVDQPLNRHQLLSRVAQHAVVEGIARSQDYRLSWHRGVGKATIFGEMNPATLSSVADVSHESYNPDPEQPTDNAATASAVHDSTASAGGGAASSAATAAAPATSTGGGNSSSTAPSSSVGGMVVETADGDDDEDEDDDEGPLDEEREVLDETCKTFLAESFTGGPRHLKKLAKNSILICSELNTPTLFITVTCNAKDPAITSRLLPGQTAYDRPEIVTMVRLEMCFLMLHFALITTFISSVGVETATRCRSSQPPCRQVLWWQDGLPFACYRVPTQVIEK